MALDQDEHDPSLDELREHFKQVIAVKDRLPDAISKAIFLITTEDAIASVTSASVAAIIRFHDPDTADSTKAKRRGPDGIDPPNILAVAADEPPRLGEDEDGHGLLKIKMYGGGPWYIDHDGLNIDGQVGHWL